jgi:acyl-coenzyme A thioesterase PaaI-like protein
MTGTLDPAALAAGMLSAVPFARTLGVQFVAVRADGVLTEVTVKLPDAQALHNHVGGPHAGALFTLGETASGAVVLAAFRDQLQRAVPLAVRADIGYLKLARGEVTATARLDRPAADVVAALDAGGRPEFGVDVEIRRADGAVTATMHVVWTLRPQ